MIISVPSSSKPNSNIEHLWVQPDPEDQPIVRGLEAEYLKRRNSIGHQIARLSLSLCAPLAERFEEISRAKDDRLPSWLESSMTPVYHLSSDKGGGGLREIPRPILEAAADRLEPLMEDYFSHPGEPVSPQRDDTKRRIEELLDELALIK